MGLFSGSGQGLTIKGAATNKVSLPPGACWTISPAGWYGINSGKYLSIQQRDPVTGTWVKVGGGNESYNGGIQYFYSDGVNYRLANQTGAVVGALLTNGGSGYTAVPTVSTTGGSIWQAIVGGAVNTTVTVTNAGTGYTYPPTVTFTFPNYGSGIQAAGYCTLSGGTVASVTIQDQGAGYTSPPIVTFTNDPREGINGIPSGYGAAAVCTLTGAGTVTGLLCIDHGQGGLTSLPTLTISGGGGGSGAAATAIMCWTVTAYAVSGGGTGYTLPPLISAIDKFPQTSPAYTNPATQSGLVVTRPASILGAVSAGAITATGQVLYDGGIYTSAPQVTVVSNGELITASATLTLTVGGANGSAYITQF